MSFANPLPAGIRQVVPDYVSDGTTTTFSFPFPLYNAADLWVGVGAAGLGGQPGNQGFTTLTLNVDYTLVINALTSATVTLTTAQTAGKIIRLAGLRTPSRTTSVVNDGVLLSVPFETELDVIEATMQELRRDVSAETSRALAAEAAITGFFSSASTYSVDSFKQAGDPDDTASFLRAFAINLRCYGTPGKTYVVNGVILNGKQFDGRGCIVQDANGAPFAFQLTGWQPMLKDVQFQDQGFCAKVTTNVGGFANGASTIAIASAAGLAAGQQLLLQDNSEWQQTLIGSISGTTITLRDTTTNAGTAGQNVVASFGLINVTDSTYARLDNVSIVNARVGVIVSSSATGEVSNAYVDVTVDSARYCGFAKYGNTHDLKGSVNLSCGVTDAFNYTGGGVAGAFGVGYKIHLIRDVTVYVNGVLQTYGVNYNFADQYTVTFLAGSYPAVGAAVLIQHYHCSPRGFIEDQRDATVAAGSQFSRVRVLKAMIGGEFQSCAVTQYDEIIFDTCQFIDLFMNNCSFGANFAQIDTTWSNTCVSAFNSSTVELENLVSDLTPSAYLSPFMPAAGPEIAADATSFVEIDVDQWDSQGYTTSGGANIALYGGRKLMFNSAVMLGAGSSNYIGPAGTATQYQPLDIVDRNGFLVAFYAAVNVQPGGTQTITLNVIRNPDTTPVTIATQQIVGASYGGYFSIAPAAVTQGDRIVVQAIYSAGAVSSYLRGYLILR